MLTEKKRILILLLPILLIFPSLQGICHASVVPETGCYHGVFVEPGNDYANPYPMTGLQTFEQDAGKNVAMVMWFMVWGWEPGNLLYFPSGWCTDITDAGKAPHITWGPHYWNSDTQITLQGIIDGNWDAYILQWANDIKNWGDGQTANGKQPEVFIRWGHEMNGDWYDWSGTSNGGATTTGYGDPAKEDGPERYIDAWRHIYDIFQNAGATNAIFIWAPDDDNIPNDSWNHWTSYYPGDNYVNWIGCDIYANWRSQNPEDIKQNMGVYSDYQVTGKPFIIAETAVWGRKSAGYITDFLSDLENKFPNTKAFCWFNTNKEHDWRIEERKSKQNAYRDGIASTWYLSVFPSGGGTPPPPPPPSDKMHISSIDMQVKQKGKNWQGIATVKIADSNNNPVKGAEVTGQWYLGGSTLSRIASAC